MNQNNNFQSNAQNNNVQNNNVQNNNAPTNDASQSVKIVSVKRGETKGNKPMWFCSTDSGVNVNIFDRSVSWNLFENAGYSWELTALKMNQLNTYHKSPILAVIIKNGNWWEFQSVDPKPEGFAPDTIEAIESGFFQQYITEQCKKILHMKKGVVVWDVETTGLTANDDIVSIGAVYGDGTPVFEQGNLFIKSNEDTRNQLMSPLIQGIHGITWDFLSDKQTFSETYDLLHQKLHGRIWVAFNQKFDVGMIQGNCLKYNLPPIAPLAIIDAMEIMNEARRMMPKAPMKNLSLEKSVALLDIIGKDAHDAQNDAWMTWKIIDHMARFEKIREPF